MRRKIQCIYSVFLALLLIPIVLMFLMNSGCGSAGGGGAYYETVEISANCEKTLLDSDVALWEDSNNNGVCDTFTITEDRFDVTVRSQSFVNTSIPPSEVRIEKVRIDYTPLDNAPALASRDLVLGQFVQPDSDVLLHIMVISQSQKKTFPLNRLRHGEACCNEIYQYLVKLTFSGRETATDKQQNFTTDLTLQAADFISNDECKFYKRMRFVQ